MEEGIDIPSMDDGRHFFLSYRLKGVCKSHCGGRNSLRTMSQAEMGRMSTWKYRFCGADTNPPVQTVEARDYVRVSSAPMALTTWIRRTHGGRGTRYRHWQQAPDIATADTVAVKLEPPVSAPHTGTGS